MDANTLAVRAGFPCSYVVYHESGMCYAVTGNKSRIGGGSKLPAGKARAFENIFKALKPSEPDMIALAIGKNKPARDTALRLWPAGHEDSRPQEVIRLQSPEEVPTADGRVRFSSRGPQGHKSERACSECGQPIKILRLRDGTYIPVDAKMYLGGNGSPPLVDASGWKHQNPGPEIRGHIPHFCNRKQPEAKS